MYVVGGGGGGGGGGSGDVNGGVTEGELFWSGEQAGRLPSQPDQPVGYVALVLLWLF